jgi:hypothetical protein
VVTAHSARSVRADIVHVSPCSSGAAHGGPYQQRGRSLRDLQRTGVTGLQYTRGFPGSSTAVRYLVCRPVTRMPVRAARPSPGRVVVPATARASTAATWSFLSSSTWRLQPVPVAGRALDGPAEQVALAGRTPSRARVSIRAVSPRPRPGARCRTGGRRPAVIRRVTADGSRSTSRARARSAATDGTRHGRGFVEGGGRAVGCEDTQLRFGGLWRGLGFPDRADAVDGMMRRYR